MQAFAQLTYKEMTKMTSYKLNVMKVIKTIKVMFTQIKSHNFYLEIVNNMKIVMQAFLFYC